MDPTQDQIDNGMFWMSLLPFLVIALAAALQIYLRLPPLRSVWASFRQPPPAPFRRAEWDARVVEWDRYVPVPRSDVRPTTYDPAKVLLAKFKYEQAEIAALEQRRRAQAQAANNAGLEMLGIMAEIALGKYMSDDKK